VRGEVGEDEEGGEGAEGAGVGDGADAGEDYRGGVAGESGGGAGGGREVEGQDVEESVEDLGKVSVTQVDREGEGGFTRREAAVVTLSGGTSWTGIGLANQQQIVVGE